MVSFELIGNRSDSALEIRPQRYVAPGLELLPERIEFGCGVIVGKTSEEQVKRRILRRDRLDDRFSGASGIARLTSVPFRCASACAAGCLVVSYVDVLIILVHGAPVLERWTTARDRFHRSLKICRLHAGSALNHDVH